MRRNDWITKETTKHGLVLVLAAAMHDALVNACDDDECDACTAFVAVWEALADTLPEDYRRMLAEIVKGSLAETEGR